MNCAVLDCGAAKTVCGEPWLTTYISTLSEEETARIVYSNSTSIFKFGSGNCIKAFTTVILPITIGSKKVSLRTDVVKEDIPLLLSRKSMKNAGTILDTKNDEVIMLDEKIPLIVTSTDHYAIPISLNRKILEDKTAQIVLRVTKANMSVKEIAIKLHKQFAHPSEERLLRLINNSEDGNNIELKNEVKGISRNCDVCKRYKHAPRRPVVGMPVATRFNQIIAMDIKFCKGKPVLHLIDVLTRFSASVVLNSKKSREIIDVIFNHWISIFGFPGTILSDNGEFASDEFRAMSEAFNIRVVTRAAESPWANGLCERYNAVIGEMVDKILEEVDCSMSVAVAWATSAKNSLQNIHGFSPAQLVFGFIPILPSVAVDKPPALSETSYSEILEDNLKALRKARAAFIQSESSKRIRRALSHHNLRPSGEVKYVNGDMVYYKRTDDSKWHAPGIVIGQDGQLVLLRTQTTWIRVHPCRLQLIDGGGDQKLEKIEGNFQHRSESNQKMMDKEIESRYDEQMEQENGAENQYGNQLDQEAQEETARTLNENKVLANRQLENVQKEDDTVEQEEDVLIEREGEENQNPMNPKYKYNKAKKFTNKLMVGGTIKYKLANKKTWDTGKIISRAGKVRGKYANSWNVESNSNTNCIDFDRDLEDVEVVDNADGFKLIHDDHNDETEEVFHTEVFLHVNEGTSS